MNLMIRSSRHLRILAAVLVLSAASCSQNPDPNVVPKTKVGQIATVGKTFLESVEVAQDSLVKLADQGVVSRPDSVRVMEGFRQVGMAGQKLAAALDVLAKNKGMEGEANAFNGVQQILINISDLLDASIVPVGDENSRKAVAGLLSGINKTLIQITLEIAASKS